MFPLSAPARPTQACLMQTTWAEYINPPEQGWTDKRMGGLKGQGKGSLGPVYLSTKGNSDLQGASDRLIKDLTSTNYAVNAFI